MIYRIRWDVAPGTEIDGDGVRLVVKKSLVWARSARRSFDRPI